MGAALDQFVRVVVQHQVELADLVQRDFTAWWLANGIAEYRKSPEQWRESRLNRFTRSQAKRFRPTPFLLPSTEEVIAVETERNGRVGERAKLLAGTTPSQLVTLIADAEAAARKEGIAIAALEIIESPEEALKPRRVEMPDINGGWSEVELPPETTEDDVARVSGLGSWTRTGHRCRQILMPDESPGFMVFYKQSRAELDQGPNPTKDVPLLDSLLEAFEQFVKAAEDSANEVRELVRDEAADRLRTDLGRLSHIIGLPPVVLPAASGGQTDNSAESWEKIPEKPAGVEEVNPRPRKAIVKAIILGYQDGLDVDGITARTGCSADNARQVKSRYPEECKPSATQLRLRDKT